MEGLYYNLGGGGCVGGAMMVVVVWWWWWCGGGAGALFHSRNCMGCKWGVSEVCVR